MRWCRARSGCSCWLGILFFLCFSAICCGSVAPGFALEPEQILVLANENAKGSVELARYYMLKRAIPEENLLQLRVTDKERCSRENFERKVVPQVRGFLQKNDPFGNIRCLVIMYGLPLKISPPKMTKEQKTKVAELKNKEYGIAEKLKALPKKKEQRRRLESDLKEIQEQFDVLTKTDYRSAFDSELALVRVKKYALKGWISNPYFIGFQNKDLRIKKDQVLMVSRLDGPNERIVKRIIDDSIAVERAGLKGKAYFDARWPNPSKEEVKKMKMGYRFYDWSIHLAAEQVKRSGWMEVIVNDKPQVFQRGDCPDAALYCGWYSLGHYVDAFDWEPGSVGYHIASAECQTLKESNSQVWCKRMLEEGVSATIGPVNEPYVQAFPVPEIFFSLLVQGRLTLAECYAVSLPYLSWQMVLVGDPLYRPFGRRDR